MNKLPQELGLGKALRSFHEDEDGLETLQVVMIVGIAAIILIVIKIFWNDIKKWAFKKSDEAIKEDSSDKKN